MKLGSRKRNGLVRRAAAAALGVSMLAGVGSVAAATAASAAYTDCPAEYTCGWVNSNYGGANAPFKFSIASFTWFSQPQCQTGTWNDCMSSVYNRKACPVDYYIDVNYMGFPFGTVPSGKKSATVGQNDQWSSVNANGC